MRNPLELLRCPACGDSLTNPDPSTHCTRDHGWPVEPDGIVDFLAEEGPHAAVNAFYMQHPFPGYARGDNAASLIDRCGRSPFLSALDAAIPHDALVADVGCGTGQLAAFLALSARARTVFGLDGCRASLDLAEAFRTRAEISNLRLVRADLFQLPLPESAFDVVVCRGVVHHTEDPSRAIARVARHVRPGGYLVLGFYESIARVPHRIRRVLGSALGRPVRWLDPVLRRADLGEEKKLTWIADQYHHPLEHCLAFPAVRRCVEGLGFDWVRSVPALDERDAFFDVTERPGDLSLLARRLGWMLAPGDQDAGLVCLVARRQGAQ